MAFAEAIARVPAVALVDPVAEPLPGLVRRDEVLHLHLLELARAEEEVARRDLVAEGLADLRDAERRLPARELEHVLEVDEDALRGLGAEVCESAGLLERAQPRREHEVEGARLGEVALRRLPGPLARLAATVHLLVLRVGDVVGAEAQLAGAAVHERVAKALHVAGRLPDLRVEDDRGVERNAVVALLDHLL